jgi:hypothetical protein
MGEYEKKQQKVSEEYSKYRDAFYAPAPGIGDEKRANHNREMAQKTQGVADALRELKAVAPAAEQASIADAIVKTQNEASEFGQRASHYERKPNKG